MKPVRSRQERREQARGAVEERTCMSYTASTAGRGSGRAVALEGF